MALIVCYTVLHAKLIFVQSLIKGDISKFNTSMACQGRKCNDDIYIYIYIYIHWSPIQYLERCFISYRFFFLKVTYVGLILN
jgi:hypothetical protein